MIDRFIKSSLVCSSKRLYPQRLVELSHHTPPIRGCSYRAHRKWVCHKHSLFLSHSDTTQELLKAECQWSATISRHTFQLIHLKSLHRNYSISSKLVALITEGKFESLTRFSVTWDNTEIQDLKELGKMIVTALDSGTIRKVLHK